MPNHPDMRMNTFTQTADSAWITVLVMAFAGFDPKLSAVIPPQFMIACMTSTRNIANILRSSMFDWRTPVVTELIAGSFGEMDFIKGLSINSLAVE